MTVTEAIKTILFFFFFWSVTIIHGIRFFSLKFWYRLRHGDFPPDLAHRLCQSWGNTLFHWTPGWSISIKGLEHLEALGHSPAIIVSNHESATDILAFYQLDLQFRWLAKKRMFEFPLIGGAMRSAEYVGVERGNKESHGKALDASRDILRSGTSMLFFPEGTRSTTGHPGKFKIGAFKLAMEENRPILPVALIGSGRLMKKGTLAPNKARIDLCIMKPQKHHKDEDIQDYTKRIENLIREKRKVLMRETSPSP